MSLVGWPYVAYSASAIDPNLDTLLYRARRAAIRNHYRLRRSPTGLGLAVAFAIPLLPHRSEMAVKSSPNRSLGDCEGLQD